MLAFIRTTVLQPAVYFRCATIHRLVPKASMRCAWTCFIKRIEGAWTELAGITVFVVLAERMSTAVKEIEKRMPLRYN